MAALPTVLAGPIVRRVEPRLCAIWIALSEAAFEVKVTLWRGIQVAGAQAGRVASNDPVVATATTPTRRFAKNLHVALVVVKIAPNEPALAPGAIYAYDVQVGTRGLKQLRLLEDLAESAVENGRPIGPNLALGYVTDRLPSFVTPPANVELTRFAHCSCRKPSARPYDALAAFDSVMAERLVDPIARTQMLFMTGDQIYADDFPGALMFPLAGLASDLMGGEEQLFVAARPRAGLPDEIIGTPPLNDSAVTMKPFAATLANFPAQRRHKLVINLAGYTTEDGENHLLSFGEYAAMYLAVWSPRVWRPLGRPDQVIVAAPPVDHPLLPHLDLPETNKKYGGKVEDWLKDAQKPGSGFSRSVRQVGQFRDGVKHVARVLANVATYMIFDDHDVTDDWNLSKKWLNRCYAKPFGRQIVRNAVMAYGLFQAWGNDPIQFEGGKNKELLDEVVKLHDGEGPYPKGPTERVDTLSGVTGAAATEQPTWSYVVPMPRAKVIVLDTRTRRKFTGQSYLPPDLIGLNRDAQLPPGPQTDGRELLIVVSAAPVAMPDLIDSLGWPLAQVAIDAVHLGRGLDGSGTQKGNIGVEKYDAEGWGSNELAREELLKRLATYPAVVLLSGDVHFGYSLTLDYYRKGVASPARMVQLTSSPARNAFKLVVKLIVRQNPALQAVAGGYAIARLGWNGASSITVPPNVSVSPGRRSRMKRSPAILPAGGWPAGSAIPADKLPDWSWRLELQRDGRGEAALPSALRQTLLPRSSELDPAQALEGYRAVVTRHQQAAVTHYDFLRQMVFTSNIGLVGIERDAQGQLALRHILMSQDAPDAVIFSANTQHVISLAPSPKPPPQLEFR